jgi:hypothetical protein
VSQDSEEEDAAMGDRPPDVDSRLLAELRALLGAVDGAPSELVASAKLAPELVDLDEEYLALVEAETAGAATRAGRGQTLAFRSPVCRLEVTVDDVGGGLVVEGQVTGVDAVEVVHERVHDSRAAAVDRFGYFTLTRIPSGLGRLVVRAADGRRLPATWVVF